MSNKKKRKLDVARQPLSEPKKLKRISKKIPKNAVNQHARMIYNDEYLDESLITPFKGKQIKWWDDTEENY